MFTLRKIIDTDKFKDFLLKVGVNFVTAGVVGVFINHIAGNDLSTMQSTAVSIAFVGLCCTLAGIKRSKR